VYSEVPDQNASCARFIAAHHLADGEPALPPPEMQHPPAASAEEEEDDDGMPAAQAAHAPPHAAGWHSAGSCDGVSEPDDMRDDSVDDGIAAARSGTRRPRAR
jgi:hypothetical protein